MLAIPMSRESSKRKTIKIDSVKWDKVRQLPRRNPKAGREVVLDKPVEAKYVRIELVENHGTPPDLPWTEISEVKIFPPAK
jgi:hypothetical protein